MIILTLDKCNGFNLSDNSIFYVVDKNWDVRIHISMDHRKTVKKFTPPEEDGVRVDNALYAWYTYLQGQGQQAIALPLFLIMSIAVLNTVEPIIRPIHPIEAYFSVNLALASFLTMFPENKTGTGSAL
jgi:hypothetical protein